MKFSILASVSAAACLDSDFSCLGGADVRSLNDDLCRQMKGMVGCSLRESCKSTPDKPFCNENVIYATLCQDMPTMSGCRQFQQCSNVAACDLVPNTANTTKQIYSICTEMNMAGCENCSIRESSTYSECDLIGTFSQLCIAMPNMPQCSQYSRMCAATKDLPFCATSESTIGRNAPTMKMFFHTGFSDYILFETWVPRSAAQFSIAWILVFLAAAGYEALQVFVSFKELHWAKKDCKSNTVLDNSAFGEVTQTKAVDNDAISLQSLCGASGGLTGIKQSFYRAILRMVSTAIGYSLMLVAMSFNVGLFIAVITGFGFGTFVFVPMIRIKLANALVTPTYATTECH